MGERGLRQIIMKLNMQIFSHMLRAHKLYVQSAPCSELHLMGVRLWDGDETQLVDGYVFVTTIACLMSCENHEQLKDVICIGYNEYIFRKFEGKGNIIMMDEPIPLLDAFYEVTECFEYFAELERRFLVAIVQQKSLDEILSVVAELFENPVIVLDESSMRVATADKVGGREIDRQKWKSILEDGHVETDTLTALAYRKRHGITPGKKAFFDSVKPNVYSAITVPLWDENMEGLGSLLIPEEFIKLNQGFLGIGDFVAPFLANQLQRIRDQVKLQFSSLEQFFSNLFSGNNARGEFAKVYFDQLNWNMTDHFMCCIIQLNETETVGEFYHFGAKRFKHILGNCFYLFYENLQVFVIDTDRSPLDEEKLTELNSMLKSRGTYAGISMEVQGVEFLGSQYALAAEALRLGNPSEQYDSIFFYKDNIEAHLIDMERRPINMLAICHPKVLELYHSDQEKGTEYIETLYVYLRNERSLLKAAPQLYIHRNSLVYRLEKINDLLQLNYEDTGLRSHILISCQIIRYYKRRQEVQMSP